MATKSLFIQKNERSWNKSDFVENWEYSCLRSADYDQLFVGPYALLCRSQAEKPVTYGPNISNGTVEYYILQGKLGIKLDDSDEKTLGAGGYCCVLPATEIVLTAYSNTRILIFAHKKVIWFQNFIKQIKNDTIKQEEARNLCEIPWLPFLRNQINKVIKDADEHNELANIIVAYFNKQSNTGNFSDWTLQLAINLCRNIQQPQVIERIQEILNKEHCTLNIRLVSLLHLMNVKENFENDFFKSDIWKHNKSFLEQKALSILMINFRYYRTNNFYELKERLQQRIKSKDNTHSNQKGYYEFLFELMKPYINEEMGHE